MTSRKESHPLLYPKSDYDTLHSNLNCTFARVRQLNCVKLHCQDLLGDNPERLFLGKLRLGSMPI